MNERVTESSKVVQAFPPRSTSSAETKYNGSVDGNTVVGIDTMNYDEALIMLQIGAISGTLDVTVLDSSIDDDSTGATAITGAAFAQVTGAVSPSVGQDGVYVGSILTKNTKRYLYVKAVTATAAAKVFGVNVLLTRADGPKPVTQAQTVAFQVN